MNAQDPAEHLVSPLALISRGILRMQCRLDSLIDVPILVGNIFLAVLPRFETHQNTANMI
jgi:hypothetical protein